MRWWQDIALHRNLLRFVRNKNKAVNVEGLKVGKYDFHFPKESGVSLCGERGREKAIFVKDRDRFWEHMTFS